jgi:hypothetical protein
MCHGCFDKFEPDDNPDNWIHREEVEILIDHMVESMLKVAKLSQNHDTCGQSVDAVINLSDQDSLRDIVLPCL